MPRISFDDGFNPWKEVTSNLSLIKDNINRRQRVENAYNTVFSEFTKGRKLKRVMVTTQEKEQMQR